MTPSEIASELTDILRVPTGTMQLRPLQARCILGAQDAADTAPGQFGLMTNAAVGLGKAQPVDEPVLTPHGWKPIGDIQPGDYVTGSDGTPVRVLSVHPQGMRPVMRVVFTDGSWTRCDPEHLWTFRRDKRVPYSDAVWCSPKRTGKQKDVFGSKWETRTLQEWLAEEGLDRKCGPNRAHKLFAPMVQPVQRPTALLPLDPYTLGALLGDGGMTQNTISFTSMDADIVEALRLPEGVAARATKCQSGGLATQYGLTTGFHSGPRSNELINILRRLELFGTGSATKFIPRQYQMADVQQRVALLQGLLDTDGATANPAGWVEYSTLSPQLADDVTELVEGLGGTAKRNKDAANGNARIGIKLPRHISPFKCTRKGEAYWKGDRQREPYRALHEVIDEGHSECVCITVDAWDSLYVTRHHIVTHNSLLLALLLSTIGGARPALCTKAAAVDQLRDDIEKYRQHFRIPQYYRILSYETISTRPEELWSLKPTFLGLDEGHLVKNPSARGGKKSGRGIRFARFRRDFPTTPMAIASGSPGEAFEQYAHLMVWAVPALSETYGGPIPVLPPDHEFAGTPGGPAFRDLCRELEDPANAPFRAAFWERVRSTPGVVISDETFTDKPLRITHHFLDTAPEMEPHWKALRETGTAPDEWQLDGMEVWDFARTMACGLFHEHDPRPPQEYRDARRGWHGMARNVIDMGQDAPGGPYDTEGQVKGACLAGALPATVLTEWQRQEPTYTPITRPVWLSQSVLEYCAQWGRERAALATRNSGGSIVWVRRTWMGEALSRMTGWAYYGEEAKNSRGGHVRNATDPVIIASTNSCNSSHNLQRFSRNLVVNPSTMCALEEQRIGRTHRSGQLADLVEAEFLYCCLEDYMAAQKAERIAAEQENDLTAPRKLLLAEHVRAAYPDVDENDTEAGYAWKRASSRVVVDIPDE